MVYLGLNSLFWGQQGLESPPFFWGGGEVAPQPAPAIRGYRAQHCSELSVYV